jgi:hypothetical protein
MNDVDISYDGKYQALTEGFLYRDFRRNPGYDWKSKVDVAAIAASIDILDPDYDKLLKEALVAAYKEEILKPKDKNLGWFDYNELANSVK